MSFLHAQNNTVWEQVFSSMQTVCVCVCVCVCVRACLPACVSKRDWDYVILGLIITQ